MKIRILTYVLCLFTILSCSTSTPYLKAVGYITKGSNDSLLIVRLKDNQSKNLFFVIDDNTKVNHDELVEGNIVEVEYLAPSTSIKYNASIITTNSTYPKVFGRWESRDRKGIKIAIELCAEGIVKQTSPKDILQFKHWQLSTQESQIELIGTLSTPKELSADNLDQPLSAKEIKQRRKIDREPQSFRTTVTLTIEEDGSEVLVFHNDTITNTKLYKLSN